MKRFIILFIVIICVSTPIIGFSENTHAVYYGDILYVGGSGHGNYTSIQAAIDDAFNGDIIYVYPGIYYENIIIDKMVTLITGGDVTINGRRNGIVVYVTANNVVINGFTICNSSRGFIEENNTGVKLSGAKHCCIENNAIINNEIGIYLEYSDSNIISNNIVMNNEEDGICLYSSKSNILLDNILNLSKYGYGIEILHSNGCIIVNNTVSDNNADGIRIRSSDDSILEGNEVEGNRIGISIEYSNNNTLNKNIIGDNRYGLSVDGYRISHYYHNIDSTNTINDKPIYYIIEQRDLSFNNSMEIGYLGLVSCSNISIQNIDLEGNYEGLLLVNTSQSMVTCCNIYSNYYGIYLLYSLNSTIEFNNLIYNRGDGVISYFSNDNDISNNNISSNDGCGIGLSSSAGNTISHNRVSENNLDGISIGTPYIHDSFANNIISENIISNNKELGVRLDVSSGNLIIRNAISSNKIGGIFLYLSYDNKICFNDFIKNNNPQALFVNSFLNIWIRNHWSDWIGIIPRPIKGLTIIPIIGLPLPWINFDWCPSILPHYIRGGGCV